MTDFYLKFPDEQTATAAMESVEGDIVMVGLVYRRPDPVITGTSTVVIPTFYTDDEGIQHEGETTEVEVPVYEYFPPVLLPGYHVNLRADDLPDELTEYQVFPQNPVSVWL